MSTFTTTCDNSNIQPNQQRIRHIFSNHFTNRPIFSVKTRLTPSWDRFVLVDDIRDALQNMDIVGLFLDENTTLPIRVFTYVCYSSKNEYRESHQSHIAYFPDQMIYYRTRNHIPTTTTETSTTATLARTTTTTSTTTRTQPSTALLQVHASQQDPFLLPNLNARRRALPNPGQHRREQQQKQQLEEGVEVWGSFLNGIQFSESHTQTSSDFCGPRKTPQLAPRDNTIQDAYHNSVQRTRRNEHRSDNPFLDVQGTQSEAHTGNLQHSEVSIAGVDNTETRPNEDEHPMDAFPGPILTVVEQIDTTIEEFRMYIRSGSDGLRNTIIVALQNLKCSGGEGYEGSGNGGQSPYFNDATDADAGNPDGIVQGLVMDAASARIRSIGEVIAGAPDLAPVPAARPLLPIESPFAAPIHICTGGTGGALPLFGNDFVAAAVARALGGGAQGTVIARASAAAENSNVVVEAPARSRAFLPIESLFAACVRPCTKSPHAAGARPLIFNVAAAVHAAATAEVRDGVTNQRAVSSVMGGRTSDSTVVAEAPTRTRAFLLIESPFADNTHPLNSNSSATTTVADTSPNPTTPPAAPRSPTHQQQQHQQQQPIIDSPKITDLSNSPTLSAMNFPYSNSRTNNLPELGPQDSWTGRIRAQQKRWFQRQAQICHQADMQFRVGQRSSGVGSGGVGRSGVTAKDGSGSVRGGRVSVVRASRRPVGILGSPRLLIPSFRENTGIAKASSTTATNNLPLIDTAAELKKSRSYIGPLDMQNPNSPQFRRLLRRRRLRRCKSEPPMFPQSLWSWQRPVVSLPLPPRPWSHHPLQHLYAASALLEIPPVKSVLPQQQTQAPEPQAPATSPAPAPPAVAARTTARPIKPSKVPSPTRPARMTTGNIAEWRRIHVAGEECKDERDIFQRRRQHREINTGDWVQSLIQLEYPYRLPPQQEARQLDEQPQEQADITNDANGTEAELQSSPSKRKRLGVNESFEEDENNTAEKSGQDKEVRRQEKRKEEMTSTVIDALSTPTSNVHRGGETCRGYRISRANY